MKEIEEREIVKVDEKLKEVKLAKTAQENKNEEMQKQVKLATLKRIGGPNATALMSLQS